MGAYLYICVFSAHKINGPSFTWQQSLIVSILVSVLMSFLSDCLRK